MKRSIVHCVLAVLLLSACYDVVRGDAMSVSASVTDDRLVLRYLSEMDHVGDAMRQEQLAFDSESAVRVGPTVSAFIPPEPTAGPKPTTRFVFSDIFPESGNIFLGEMNHPNIIPKPGNYV